MDAPHQSKLFYQSRHPRPMLDHAEGIYIWDRSGRRWLDGSSGAMVANIGHSNPRVLEAMRRQMQSATFGYRLHFENEPAERLAEKTVGLATKGLDRVFFGLIIHSRRSRGGYSGDHFLVCPQMITTESQVDEIMEKLTASLDQFVAEKALVE